MMKRFLCLLALLIGTCQAGMPETCVLVFQMNHERVAKVVDRFFSQVPQVKLVKEAVPLDLLDCIEQGAQEIIVVAHGFWMPESGKEDPAFRLGYFTKKNDQYQVGLFYNRIFERAYRYLEEERRLNGSNRLRRLRLAACGIEAMRETHPYLHRLVEDFVSDYDEAPASRGLLTKLISGGVPGVKRAISYRWLSESGKCERAVAWQTKKNQRGSCTSDRQPGCDRSRATYCRAVSL